MRPTAEIPAASLSHPRPLSALAGAEGWSRVKAAPISAHWPAALACLGLLLAGCRTSIKPTFDSPEPAARNAAIVNAAATKDTSAVPDLIRMLSSDDPATRLLAITTLQRLTGTSHGFDYTDTELLRSQAIERWLAAYPPRDEAAPVGSKPNPSLKPLPGSPL